MLDKSRQSPQTQECERVDWLNGHEFVQIRATDSFCKQIK